MGHPIENLMKTTMESLKAMVDVNTVVGDAVETKDGTVIVPVSRVSFGFVAGGGDDIHRTRASIWRFPGHSSGAAEQSPYHLPAAAVLGSVPVGFLVVGDGKVRFLPVDSWQSTTGWSSCADLLIRLQTSWSEAHSGRKRIFSSPATGSGASCR